MVWLCLIGLGEEFGQEDLVPYSSFPGHILMAAHSPEPQGNKHNTLSQSQPQLIPGISSPSDSIVYFSATRLPTAPDSMP
jgi:hypothetical protein